MKSNRQDRAKVGGTPSGIAIQKAQRQICKIKESEAMFESSSGTRLRCEQ